MVSLGRAGGHFVDQDYSQETELLQDIGVASYQVENGFQPISTILALSFQVLILITSLILTFLLPHLHLNEYKSSVLIYHHAALLLFISILGIYLQFQHKKFWRRGYLEFYKKTTVYREKPIYIVFVGTFILLLTTTLSLDHCKEVDTCTYLYFESQYYIEFIVTLEIVAVLVLTSINLVKTVQFNHLKAPPDVEQDEITSSYMQGQVPYTNIGFRDENRIEDILEKQADLICYLKQHNAMLGKKIIHLTTELQARSVS